jgi:hypothetical protein
VIASRGAIGDSAPADPFQTGADGLLQDETALILAEPTKIERQRTARGRNIQSFVLVRLRDQKAS